MFVLFVCVAALIGGATAIDPPPKPHVEGGRRLESHESGPPTVNHKIFNYGLKYRITHLINMSITVDGRLAGHVVIGLFGRTTPKTAENFRALCTGEYGFGYINSSFHRIIRGFVIQGGDFEKGDGFGGHSIYNNFTRFDDENYLVPHSEGSVAMASEKKKRNGSQFYMLLSKDAPHLDRVHVVFGHILEGFRTVIRGISNAHTDHAHKPNRPIRVQSCTAREYVDDYLERLHREKGDHLIDDEEASDAGTEHFEGPRRPHDPKHPRRDPSKKDDGKKDKQHRDEHHEKERFEKLKDLYNGSSAAAHQHRDDERVRQHHRGEEYKEKVQRKKMEGHQQDKKPQHGKGHPAAELKPQPPPI